MSYNSRFIRIALLSIFAGAVLTACNAHEAFEESLPNEGNIIISVEAEDEPETRSCIDPTQYSGGVTGLLWSPQDSIGVFSAGGNENARFVSNSDENVKNAVFAGTMGAVPEYAYFPYTSENDGVALTELKGSVGAVQRYDIETKLLNYDWKYGRRKSDYS